MRLLSDKLEHYITFYYYGFNQCTGRSGSRSKKVDISVNDRVSVFLELAEAHRTLDQQVKNVCKRTNRHSTNNAHLFFLYCFTFFLCMNKFAKYNIK